MSSKAIDIRLDLASELHFGQILILVFFGTLKFTRRKVFSIDIVIVAIFRAKATGIDARLRVARVRVGATTWAG